MSASSPAWRGSSNWRMRPSEPNSFGCGDGTSLNLKKDSNSSDSESLSGAATWLPESRRTSVRSPTADAAQGPSDHPATSDEWQREGSPSRTGPVFRSSKPSAADSDCAPRWAKPKNRNIHPNFVSPSSLHLSQLGSNAQAQGADRGIPSDGEPPETLAAIAQGRRIYVGNLLYSAKPDDIEGLLASCGLSHERIHISIDPFTGRNPSYCFVEFATKAAADSAMSLLSGQTLLGRGVKCGPCAPKARTDRGETFRRWGDWKRTGPAAPPEVSPASRDVELVEDGGARITPIKTTIALDGGPREALRHWAGMADARRRLYVGGLPRMADQRTCDEEVRALFRGFTVEAVSKAISPFNKENRESVSRNHPNSYYCFVDFPTAQEATLAAREVNGRRLWGGRLRVSHAKIDSRKWREREQFKDWAGRPGNAAQDA